MDSDVSGMKIIAVVWQVPATGLSIEYDPSSEVICPDDILHVTNPYDLCAVTEAVRIRDSQAAARVTVIAIGPARVEAVLRQCLAIGADEAVHIPLRPGPRAFYDLCRILSEALKNGEYDLILCGEETLDDYGCVAYPGPYLAGALEISQVSSATKIEISGKEIMAQRKIEHGDREMVRCAPPCVISVDKTINVPLYPGLPDIFKGKRAEILKIDPASLGAAELEMLGCHANDICFSMPRKRVKKTMSIDTNLSAADRMKMLMSGGLTQKDSTRLITGDASTIAQNIISVLEKRGII